mgnify:CR=1 FL=1
MFNKVIFVGNLTRDIELRYTPNGAAIAKSAIASTYSYKTNTGEKKDEVCFLDFTIFNRRAEVANQYLKQGSKVLLEGRLVFEQWTAQDGTNRNKHSLRVDEMKMLDNKQNNDTQASPAKKREPEIKYQNAQGQAITENQAKQNIANSSIEDEDEIPF